MTEPRSISHTTGTYGNVRADRKPLSSPPPHPSDSGHPVISAPQPGLVHRAARQRTGEDVAAEEPPTDETTTDDAAVDEAPVDDHSSNRHTSEAPEEPELDLSSFPPPMPPPNTALVEPAAQPEVVPEDVNPTQPEEPAQPAAEAEMAAEPEPEPEHDLSARDLLAARATKPELGKLELRQVAGLTSGVTLTMD